MKVRIGNDIKLKVQLTFGEDTDMLNINSAKAILVNTTLKEKLEREFKKMHRFFGRFPIEPFVDEFEPSAYNIHSTGYPKYRAIIPNPYKGFGVYPDWKNVFPIKDINVTVYHAEVKRISPDTIVVMFPAEAQLYPGEYSLIVKAKIQDPGYKHGERTVCANYNNMFEIVSDTEDADETGIHIIDQPAVIDVVEDPDQQEDVYVAGGTYNNGVIRLQRNDNGVVDIDVTELSDIASWYENDQ